ncbi:GNAT family N-acetyltransferase [Phycicoccus endophyticus]|uniref:GNAT family N-acetyltransferase n=1 Tax=Phycicoccus endophyticus TaxID=1690220 RepID=A0A7G9R2B9_9MICO|nr:GNAT family protein [Phycicoccus endophyticus]NHI19582.1 GNAT family N-acetyltransferase [Phycicoccus endophyticus]QNN49744.1 GNAT family N-acetyltransferase [Phycicoccus endophyticus]GGL34751.1 N-acetyltransferase GCN5 [Phycicoccus endophyticus]
MWRRLRAGAAGADAAREESWVWPLRLSGRTPAGVDIVLRPLELADEPVFQSVRRANAAWLEPWDATSPLPQARPRTFGDLLAQYEADGASGRGLPLAVEVRGRLVGQVNVGTVVLGSFRSCTVGYWVSRSLAGRMVVPTAVALVADHLFGRVGLHRMEVNIRPENTSSLAVVRKLGFRAEGLRPRYLHIDGAWRDHLSFALTTEDLEGETVLERLVRRTGEEQPSHESLARHTEAGAGPGG